MTELKTAEKRDRNGEGPSMSQLAGLKLTSINVIDEGRLCTNNVRQFEQRSSSTSYRLLSIRIKQVSQVCSPSVLKLGFPNQPRVFQNQSTQTKNRSVTYQKQNKCFTVCAYY